MIEYQNIFTQVQVRGPAEMGLDNEAGTMAAERMGTPWFSNLAGWIGTEIISHRKCLSVILNLHCFVSTKIDSYSQITATCVPLLQR
ncbi:hypothetical protein OAQ47_07155 [Paracoccaceae bacterium]|nr:hypothetical protein [Paracoccaceae bacterium]